LHYWWERIIKIYHIFFVSSKCPQKDIKRV